VAREHQQLNVDVVSIQPFKGELYEMYNADETGLFWNSLPNSTMASWRESNIPGLEASKQCVSLLLFANAGGDNLLVSWCGNKSNKMAWFTREFFEGCFHHVFVHAVRQFQMTIHGVPRQEVKALLIFDND
ncbi:Tigger transposable element-derived protein 7-like 57, partial [Homarus americanus]